MRNALRRLSLAALMGSFTVTAVQAQSPPAPPPTPAASEAPIVVTGTRLTPEQARERAVEFIRGTGVAAGDRSVARWVDPVCIDIIGISDRHAEIVKERLHRIAQAAGVPVRGGRCTNNLAVVFTTDAGAMVREVERRSPRRLEEVRGENRTRLLESNAPIRWWYTTQPRSAHGMRATTNSPAFTSGMSTNDSTGTNSATSGGGSVLPADVPNLYHYNSSIVSTQAVRALVSASVIIDVDTMRMPLEAVAAYIAMVGFAEIRENDFVAQGSILGMFADSADAPRNLTDWDMAFLRVLYRLRLDRDARRHRGILVRDLLAAVEAGG